MASVPQVFEIWERQRRAYACAVWNAAYAEKAGLIIESAVEESRIHQRKNPRSRTDPKRERANSHDRECAIFAEYARG